MRIRGLVEADVAVDDLQEGEARLSGLLRFGLPSSPTDFGTPADYRPQHAGSGPDHAFERVPAADAVVVMFVIRHLLSLSARPKLALQKVDSGSGPFIPEMDD